MILIPAPIKTSPFFMLKDLTLPPCFFASGDEIVTSLLFHAEHAHFTSMAVGDDGKAGDGIFQVCRIGIGWDRRLSI